MRTVPSAGPGNQAGAVGREDGRANRVENIAVSAEHADQFAGLGLPEAERRVVRGRDDARPVRAEEDVDDSIHVPAQDGQQPPRAPVPEPRRLVRGSRGRPRAVRAERNRIDFVPVSGQHGQQPAAGRVPKAGGAFRVLASRKQP